MNFPPEITPNFVARVAPNGEQYLSCWKYIYNGIFSLSFSFSLTFSVSVFLLILLLSLFLSLECPFKTQERQLPKKTDDATLWECEELALRSFVIFLKCFIYLFPYYALISNTDFC